MNSTVRFLIVSFVLATCTHGYTSGNEIKYSFSKEAVKIIPDITQRANSTNLNDRISVLEQLIVNDPGSDIFLYQYAYDLPQEDYFTASMSVLEGGLFSSKDVEKVRDVFGKISQAAIQFKLLALLSETVKFIEYDDPIVQIQTLMILEQLEGKQYAKEIVKAASSPNIDVSRPALRILMKFDSKEAVPVLITCLKEEDNFGIKMNAIEALGRIGDRSAIPHLIPLLKTKFYPWTLYTLVSLDAREALPAIKELYKTDKLNKSKISILVSLAYFGDEQAIADIMAAMTDEKLYDNITPTEPYLEQLVEKNARPVIPALIKALEEEQAVGGHNNRGPNIIHYIMKSLAQLEAKEAIPVLRLYLQPQCEPASFFSEVAIEALSMLKDKEIIPHLLQMLNSDLYSSRSVATMALARIGEPSTIGNLITAMRKYKIKNSEIFELLTGISDPNTYNKLKTTKIPLIESLPGGEFLLQISDKCDVEFLISDKIPKIDEFKLTNAVWSSYTGLQALNLAIYIFNTSGRSEATYFINDKIVHVVTFEEVFDLWENWVVEYRKTHPEKSD